ncbi:hypothetical protein BH10PAT4_BH10PAT4_1040 [soil metagenome]
MNKLLFPRITVSIIALSIIFGFIQTSNVNAQEAAADAAQGIQVSPALAELNAERGKTYTLTLKVVNVTLTKLTYTTTVNDFNSKSETGAANVILDGSLPKTASVIDWVSVLSGFTLDTRESRTISAEITIPNDAEPGGHYGVIRFSGQAPELSGTGVGLSASTGMLLLIRVSGDIKESASLASFYTANNGNQTSFFETSPIGFVTRIKNEGNIHVKPVGNIAIRDAFGNSVATVPVNDTKSNVLPGSIRRFDGEYKGGWMVGMYTADLTLGYGTTGQAITNTITFWVIPYKIILVGLLILITLVFIASRLIKVYNRHIITKAKNEKTKNKEAHKTKK